MVNGGIDKNTHELVKKMSIEGIWPFRKKKRYKARIKLFKQKDLHETWLGDPKGAKRQFRDNKEIDSVHVREYPDRISFHVDKFNPERRPLEHLMEDVPASKRNGAILGSLTAGILTWIITKNRGLAVFGALGGAIIGYALADDQ